LTTIVAPLGKVFMKKNINKIKKKLSKVISISEQPLSPPRQMTLGDAYAQVELLMNANQFPQAIHIAKQVLEALPTDGGIAVKLLQLQMEAGDKEGAQAVANKVMRLFPKDANVINAVSSYYRSVADTENAVAVLEKGIAVAKDKEQLYVSLGHTYTATGEKEKSVECFEKAIAFGSNKTPPFWGIVRQLKGKTSPKIIKKLEYIVGHQKSIQEKELAAAHFALAWYYETHDIEKYWHHLHIGNAKAATDSKQWSMLANKEYNTLAQLFTPEFIAKKTGSFDRELKQAPIFIVAPPRSGTTLLEQILAAHSTTKGVGESTVINYGMLRTAGKQNIPYFVGEWNPEKCDEYFAYLRREFEGHPTIKKVEGYRVVDKSIENYKHVGAILLAYPKSTVIRLKRFPLDTILSCYHQFFNSGYDHLFNLEILAHYYVHYQRMMDFWEKAFPDRILTVDYEELVSDQEKITRELLEFCDLPWEEACLQYHKNVQSVMTSSDVQVRQPIYKDSVEKWKRHEQYLQPAITILKEAGHL